jgi:hypothetical protein
MEVLMSEEFKKDRRLDTSEDRESIAPVLDSGFEEIAKFEETAKAEDESKPFTKADFEATLKKVAQKIEPEK